MELATRQNDISTSVIIMPAATTPPPPIIPNKREMRGFERKKGQCMYHCPQLFP